MFQADLDTSVADWVIEHPETLPVFEELGIDYCCGGRSLAAACQARNLDPHDVLVRLQACLPVDHVPPLCDHEPEAAEKSIRAAASSLSIWTIGHSTRTIGEFIVLLLHNNIEILVNVRHYPGSRRLPHFNKSALQDSLTASGIRYEHLVDLGGRRAARPDSYNLVWKNASFRGYADYMETPAFKKGMERLVELAMQKPTAIMCAEAVPWRCHRSLIADALIARGYEVRDILSVESAKPHIINTMARIYGQQITYPAEECL